MTEGEEMKMRQTHCRRLAACLVFLMLFLSGMQGAAAENTGTLTIYFHGKTPAGTEINLSDTVFHIHKAAVMVNGEWTLTEPFQDAGITFEDTGASQMKKNAERLQDYALENAIPGQTEKTGDNGRVSFEKLDMGMYLIYQDSDRIWEENGQKTGFRSAPFLISIPSRDTEGNTLWTVTAEPKNEWITYEEEKPSKDPENHGNWVQEILGAAQTGDPTRIMDIIMLLSTSTAITVMAAKFRQYRKKGSDPF